MIQYATAWDVDDTVCYLGWTTGERVRLMGRKRPPIPGMYDVRRIVWLPLQRDNVIGTLTQGPE